MGKTLYELVFLASADFLQPIWNASLAFLSLSAVLLLIDMMAVRSKGAIRNWFGPSSKKGRCKWSLSVVLGKP
jgi:hypothetical protein